MVAVRYLSVFLLSPYFFELPALLIQFGLVSLKLPLLFSLCVLLPLELIAEQSACTQAETTSDGGSGTRMVHCCTNETARSGASHSTNSSPFFPGR